MFKLNKYLKQYLRTTRTYALTYCYFGEFMQFGSDAEKQTIFKGTEIEEALNTFDNIFTIRQLEDKKKYYRQVIEISHRLDIDRPLAKYHESAIISKVQYTQKNKPKLIRDIYAKYLALHLDEISLEDYKDKKDGIYQNIISFHVGDVPEEMIHTPYQKFNFV